MVKELLVMTGQSCGMNCLKGYEPYALLLYLKEKLITCSLYDTQTPARQSCKTVCSMYLILKDSIVLLYKSKYLCYVRLLIHLSIVLIVML